MVHVMGDVVGVPGGEIGPVAAVERLEEIVVNERLEADALPVRVRINALAGELTGDGDAGRRLEPELEEL